MNLLCKPYSNQHHLFSLIYNVDFEKVSWPLNVMLGQVLSSTMLICSLIPIANKLIKWVITFALHVLIAIVNSLLIILT